MKARHVGRSMINLFSIFIFSSYIFTCNYKSKTLFSFHFLFSSFEKSWWMKIEKKPKPLEIWQVDLCMMIVINNNWFCRLWEKFLMLLVFYSAWVCPFEFGFLEKSKGALSITDNIVNGFFAIDIVLTFFIAYLDKSSYLFIDNPKLIAKRYAKSWLIFDIISTIPSEVVHSLLPPSLQTYGYFNILRLWRLHKASAMFARYSNNVCTYFAAWLI